MKILFLGSDYGTSRHRAAAMVRMGHQVRVLDPAQFVPSGKVLAKFHYETGGLLAQKHITCGVLASLGTEQFDFTWVEGGRYIGPQLVSDLHKRFGPVINYNNDDPFGKRDRYSWQCYRQALSTYDLVAVVREVNVKEAYAAGAKKVIRIFMSADEVAHAPRELTDADYKQWDSEVLFVGTWFPERGPFMAELIRRGVPLSIIGNRWEKAREWPIIQKAWKRPGTTNDEDYAKAIQCSKVCLGLLSKANRDLHTTRSLEVPHLGALFCAERTTEHQSLYCEGKEAAFWSDAAECAEVCQRLLADDQTRQRIAQQGRLRCLENGHLNEQIITRLLSEVVKQ